jgi:hypothetical protein
LTAMSQSPWRFLSPLSGELADRDLLNLTRGEELNVLTNMIASSRVTLLYSSSGVGKTSLINAGIVPFFAERGYAIVRVRPRPPWATQDPVEAFRSSALHDIVTPAGTQASAEMLMTARQELQALDDTAAAAIKKVFSLVEKRVGDLESDVNVGEALKEYMAPYGAARLRDYLAHLQSYPGFIKQVCFLVICDQFEELFVHYANSPQIREYCEQLGEAWADKSLRIQFLFSMREEWVGSMIEFRDTIPGIFGSYFRLQPIHANVARQVLTVPLARIGKRMSEDAMSQILADLAGCYRAYQSEHRLAAGLPISPDDNPFVELPALQLVCDQLWETREHPFPFSLKHYQSLSSMFEGSTAQSPAEAVLENYLFKYLKVEDAAEPVQDLRLDLLYLLTDKVSHRKAASEETLFRELKTVRPHGLGLASPTRESIRTVLKPLIEEGLVQQPPGQSDMPQFELAHDFVVRSVVRAWDQLDRKRTMDLARAERVAQAKERKFVEMAESEQRIFDLIQYGPAVGILATLGVALLIYARFFVDLIPTLKWVIMGAYGGTCILAWLKRQWLAIGFCGLEIVSAGVMFASITERPPLIPYPNNYPTNYPTNYYHGSLVTFWAILFAVAAAMVLYPLVILKVSRRINGSAMVQRILLITWGDSVGCLIFALYLTLSMFLSFVAGGYSWDRRSWILFVGLMLIFVIASAGLLRRYGWHGWMRWTELKLQGPDGKSLSFSRLLWRAGLHTLWLALSAFLVPLVIIGPFCIYFSRRHVSVYDWLARVDLVSETAAEKAVAPAAKQIFVASRAAGAQ